MFGWIRSGALVAVAAVMAMSLLVMSGNELGAQSNSAEIVKERKAFMKSFEKNFGPIFAVIKGKTSNLTDAAAAAERLNIQARKLVALFPAGTGRDTVPETRAKPEVWSQRAEFEAAAERLIAATGKLAAAGKANDLAAFKGQFRPFAKSCGGCHSAKSAKGGKFRFPKE